MAIILKPSKSYLIVHPPDMSQAQEIFGDSGVQIVSGHRFLGGYVGDPVGSMEFVQSKVETWVHCIECLAQAADSHPQAAHAALSHSLQFEWFYLSRVVPDCTSAFDPLRAAIRERFWSSLLGDTASEVEKSLFSLPIRHGGLGIRDPVDHASRAFPASRSGSEEVVSALKGLSIFSVESHLNRLNDVRSAFSQNQQSHDSEVLDDLLGLLSPGQRRAVVRSIEGKTSGWLGVLPLACHHFDLSEVEFRDALALRYHRPLLRMSSQCDGCGAPFSLTHALDCRKGGLVTQRHNEIRDALGDLAAMGFKEVLREPVVRESDDTLGIPALIADLSVEGSLATTDCGVV